MYNELVKALREAHKHAMELERNPFRYAALYKKAADAIEALQATVEGYESTTNMALVEKDGETVIEFVPKWIPVTERLPEQEKQVLVTGIEAIGNVQIYGVKQLDGDVWRPTSAPSCYWEHWMPLPEPPKEE